jgi:hypothetical protein
VIFICVKFKGGLGNQLFQYATARALMRNDGILYFEIADYNQDYPGRSFSLMNYRVKGKVMTGNFVKKIFTQKTKFNQLISSFGLFDSINEEGFFLHRKLGEESKLFTTLQGYWQSEHYFSSIRAELLNELIPLTMPPVFPNMIRQQNTVAVHVRRTDYLNDERYGFLGELYYRNAMAYMKQQLNNPVFIIFSDDPGWCKQSFANEHVLFCDDENWQSDYLQLYLMSKCKHQIIANSSFSWWGAWLNSNEGKIVVRPERPFKDESLYYENYYPGSWISI